MADPDNGVLERALASAEEGEAGHEGLGVVVYEVVARAPIDPPGINVGVVTVHEDVGLKTLEGAGEEVKWPEYAVAGRPCLLGAAVESVDEDNVHLSVRVGVHGRGLVSGYRAVLDAVINVVARGRGDLGARSRAGAVIVTSRTSVSPAHCKRGDV